MQFTKNWHIPVYAFCILAFAVVLNTFLLFNPLSILYNELFSPCENGFSYDTQLNQCNCIEPFYGDYCEKSKCQHGSVAVKGTYGWKCECKDLWFGDFC